MRENKRNPGYGLGVVIILSMLFWLGLAAAVTL